jgi:hypothetical protein
MILSVLSKKGVYKSDLTFISMKAICRLLLPGPAAVARLLLGPCSPGLCRKLGRIAGLFVSVFRIFHDVPTA